MASLSLLGSVRVSELILCIITPPQSPEPGCCFQPLLLVMGVSRVQPLWTTTLGFSQRLLGLYLVRVYVSGQSPSCEAMALSHLSQITFDQLGKEAASKEALVFVFFPHFSVPGYTDVHSH